MENTHPDAPMMSYEEFIKEHQEAPYQEAPYVGKICSNCFRLTSL